MDLDRGDLYVFAIAAACAFKCVNAYFCDAERKSVYSSGHASTTLTTPTLYTPSPMLIIIHIDMSIIIHGLKVKPTKHNV